MFSAGKLDNGTDGTVNGDTVFFIGSVSKTFTTLTFLDMVEHGEVKLDDPLAKYLPPSVKVPSYQGRQITLNDLATQTAGLPFNPDSMKGPDDRADYEQFHRGKNVCVLVGVCALAPAGHGISIFQRGHGALRSSDDEQNGQGL